MNISIIFRTNKLSKVSLIFIIEYFCRNCKNLYLKQAIKVIFTVLIWNQ